MSNKTYLLLNNKLMESFLINCGLLDIRNDKNDSYDILFCDSLELYNNNKINANKKVYLACWLLESLDDISNYNDFQYYIGFGQDFYDKLKENTGFECSKILDGFIDNRINKEERYYSDIFIIGNINNEINSILIMQFIEYISLLFKFNKIKDSINIKSNLMKLETSKINLFAKPDIDIYNSINFLNIDFCYSYEYLKNTSLIFCIDNNISLLYCNKNILNKCIFSSTSRNFFISRNEEKIIESDYLINSYRDKYMEHISYYKHICFYIIDNIINLLNNNKNEFKNEDINVSFIDSIKKVIS